MFQQVTKEKLPEILSYLADDVANCLYMYGDLELYGVDDPNIKAWYSEKNGEINTVILKYFQGSHVYSKKLNHNIEEVIEKIKEISPDRVSSQRQIAKELYEALCDEYDVEYGCVFKLTKYRKMESPVKIEKAKVEDAEAIADLLMTHEAYSESYLRDNLAEELRSRMENGFGRSYIIRDGDRIVAHDCVSLETSKYAVEGLALVHDDFRKTLYGSFLDSYMINDLGEEGKELYCMIVEGRRLDAFIKLGNKVEAEYGKIFRKAIKDN